jgi:NAD(P)-dependent dehydrogenase (short-subunit alcohol dehydrogenase family)
MTISPTTAASGRIQGKRAIITGAGSGMGRAAARRFHAEGASVALVDLDEGALDAIVSELGGGDSVLALPADVRDEAAIEAAVARTAAAWGGLDIVVGNAGVQLAGQDDRADRLSLEVWKRTIDINLTGMFLICKHGIKALLAGGGGAVVCTASPTGQYGCAPGYDAYSSSKAGVYGLIRVMAADYAPTIRVNGVIPGYSDTAMTSWVTPADHEALLATIPMRRPGTAEEVASVMLFLASDEASYVTGAVWAADGGMTAI